MTKKFKAGFNFGR